MKTLLSFLIFPLILACSGEERIAAPPDRFTDFMNKYFTGYSYQYKDTSARGNQNYGEQYGLLKIKKNDLTQGEMINIYEKLQKDGWRLVESNNKNYFHFCYGEDLSLNILFPITKNDRTPSGAPLNYDDTSFWYMSIYKSTTKIAECNQNEGDFIDFTKL
ncbi:hypothetical protein [Acinetobacter rudis]|uniref:hypothetical protein n=1 Tax=Acinetobacter rudis TaxID=632955 RepID=UPI00333ECCAE